MSIKNNELQTVNNAFTQLDNFYLNTAISEELEGLAVTFERVKIPSAGSIVFELPGEDSDAPDTVREFSAVILHHHPLFAYYTSKYTGANNPPACGSFDGVTGEGNPGGSCARCPYNQFGSGENGSKACKNRRRIYVLREGEIFPLLLSLPTGSLKEFTRYIKRLLGKGKKTNAVVTRFSLKKAVNSGGISYSQAQFTIDRLLNDSEQSVINKLSAQIKDYCHNVGYEVDEAVSGDETTVYVDPETGEVIYPLK